MHCFVIVVGIILEYGFVTHRIAVYLATNRMVCGRKEVDGE